MAVDSGTYLRLKKNVASEHVMVSDLNRCSLVMPRNGFHLARCPVTNRPAWPKLAWAAK